MSKSHTCWKSIVLYTAIKIPVFLYLTFTFTSVQYPKSMLDPVLEQDELFKSLTEDVLLTVLHINVFNRPFYSGLFSDLAFVWKQGLRWPCFDTDLSDYICWVK